MTKDYGPLRDTATRLVTKFGQPGTVRRTTHQPSERPGEPGEATTADYPCKFVRDNWKEGDHPNFPSINATDGKVIIAADSVEPQASDQLVVQGRPYEIVRVMPTNPGGKVLVYEAQVTF